MNITEHARARCLQRGISQNLLQIIYAEADRQFACGGGCFAIEVSRRRIAERRRIVGANIERARNVILVLSMDNSLVTVLRANKSKSARQYRTN
ncbi:MULTISPECIES: hypothetical protein [unclassified Mesorhizobium]|uniref:hypothetical protein n=1 Tax=unclassified Mesorhizobium TaxID=325217 RepID=UPI003334A97A